MGIRDLFSKRAQDEVVGTKILVASLDPKFVEVANADSRCYSQFYPTPTESGFERAEDLFSAIGKRYDVVHLFCEVTPDGNITDVQGRETAAATLMQSCLDSDVKLLWLANENKPQGYMKGFKPGRKPLNLVLTLDRKGSRFSRLAPGQKQTTPGSRRQ